MNNEREIGNVDSAALCVNDEFDESEMAALIEFFRLLDKWDREVTHNAEIM